MTATVLPIRDQSTPTTTGQTLIAMVRDLVRAHARADNEGGMGRDDKMNAAWVGTYSAARATAFIPIESAIEALAQAVFLQDEISDVLAFFLPEEGEICPPHIQDAVQAIKARPVLLAKWLEDEFEINRKDWALEFFATDELGCAKHLPHLAG